MSKVAKIVTPNVLLQFWSSVFDCCLWYDKWQLVLVHTKKPPCLGTVIPEKEDFSCRRYCGRWQCSCPQMPQCWSTVVSTRAHKCRHVGVPWSQGKPSLIVVFCVAGDSAGAHKCRHFRVPWCQGKPSLIVVFGVVGDSARAHKWRHVGVAWSQLKKSFIIVFGVAGDSARAHKWRHVGVPWSQWKKSLTVVFGVAGDVTVLVPTNGAMLE